MSSEADGMACFVGVDGSSFRMAACLTCDPICDDVLVSLAAGPSWRELLDGAGRMGSVSSELPVEIARRPCGSKPDEIMLLTCKVS